MSFRKKTDGNHKALVQALRSVPGVSVVDLSAVGEGCPDLLIGYNGYNYLFEIKNPETNGKLNLRQQKFFNEWKGNVQIVKDIDDLIDAFGWTPF